MRPPRTRGTRVTVAGLTFVVVVVAVVLHLQLRDSGPPGTLVDAVRASDVSLVRAHLEAGADPDGSRVLGLTPLMLAAVRDDASIVALLLEAGADPHATAPEGIAAHHAAAQTDARASIEVLLAAGADLGSMSHNGMNTLHHAAALGSIGVIEFVAEQGMDLDVRSEVVTQGHGHPRDRGATALGIAARAGQFDAVETLLALGADVDALSTNGHSPLLLAVFSGHSPPAVAALLAAGADPRIEASCDAGGCIGKGGDVLAWARELNRQEMVPLLEAAIQSR